MNTFISYEELRRSLRSHWDKVALQHGLSDDQERKGRRILFGESLGEPGLAAHFAEETPAGAYPVAPRRVR
jgi:hypothetical protein